jgi:fructose-1,6-bisphosphatase/inositol monophosphatase family enzyme
MTEELCLPPDLATAPWAARALAAVEAATSAGAALLTLRFRHIATRDVGDQLKTAVDLAAEGWVLGYLQGCFPDDAFLCEEAFSETGADVWQAPDAFWAVDALDGTRSFVDGFPGFVVQAGWVEKGDVKAGVIVEPVANCCYVAIAGHGAWKRTANGPWERLSIGSVAGWPPLPRFVDSTAPVGRAGRLFQTRHGRFIESGSIGLKLCRVADGSADLFVKALRFRLWDVIPGALLITEAGGTVGLWAGDPIPMDGRTTEFTDLVAAPDGLFNEVVADLAALDP